MGKGSGPGSGTAGEAAGTGGEAGEARFFATADELRAWFAAHHETADELILGFYRARTGRSTVTWAEAVDEALCVGWIDSIQRGLDDEAYTLRFTPRRRRSTWSRTNIANVERLMAEGRMLPAGIRAFEARTPERTGVSSIERDGERTLAPDEEVRLSADAAAGRGSPPARRGTGARRSTG